MSKDECQELRNIRFRTGSVATQADTEHPGETASTVEAILETESATRNEQPWSRLDRATRLARLEEYATRTGQERSLSGEEVDSLKMALRLGTERRRLERARDVQYDRACGRVIAVPNLVFNQASRRYTLKRSDKRVSTLKSLGPGRRGRNRKARKEKGT